jgi:drug/metabolite transporter (DMT)-like permease
MIAVVGGLGAAVSWAIATLGSSRTSRMIGPMSVLGWVMVFGFVASIPPVIASGPAPAPVSAAQALGLLLNGLTYTAGLLLAYQALVIGRVSIVAPILSTEGALAAAASVALGEPLGSTTAVLLAAIAVGVVLASIDRRADEAAEAGGPDGDFDPDDPAAAVPAPTAPEPAARPRHRREDPATTRRSIALAVGAAVTFSVGLIVSARLGDIPVTWIMLTSRGAGVVLIAIPLAMRGRLRLSRRAFPFVLLSGVLEAAGNGLYVIGAHASPATAAVLSSQFAAIAAVAAFLLFGERLARIQLAGVSLVAAGITCLAIIRA